MNMVLTLDILLDAFEKYNLAIWPMQVVAYVLGLGALFFAFRRTTRSSKIIAAILSFLWLWTGIGFFLLVFAPAYTPAYAFGVLFIVQGVLFLASAWKERISFAFRGDLYAYAGILFVAYATIGYPLVGLLLGHRYPLSPPFGLTPCPLAVFTFGLMLLTDKRVPRPYLAIPLFWALGGIMPVSVGILEDIGLILSGVLGTALLVQRDRKLQG